MDTEKHCEKTFESVKEAELYIEGLEAALNLLLPDNPSWSINTTSNNPIARCQGKVLYTVYVEIGNDL